MQKKLVVVGVLSIAALAFSTLGGAAISSARRQTLVNFTKLTLIADAWVIGQVVIEHDDEKMARGEACTTVYGYDRHAQFGHGKEIVSFHCKPSPRAAVSSARVRSESSPNGVSRLLDYQLVGETEAHGVPRAQ